MAKEQDGTFILGRYNIQLANKIGQGTFGVVYPGTHLSQNIKIAAKQCELKSDEHGSMAMREIKQFQQLQDHMNIVKMLDFHFHDHAFWILMEFCDQGDLVKYVTRTNPSESMKFSIMYQTARAIHYMHTRPTPIVHRDIKPANIMMMTSEDKASVVVKVTDFGLSKIVDIDPNMTVLFTTAAGTPGFMAPEFFLGEGYGMEVDIFALGLVFLSLVSYRKGDTELLPLTDSVRKSRAIMPLGMVMVNMNSVQQPMPTLFEDNPEDSVAMSAVKEVIVGMTVFKPKDRTSLAIVEQKFEEYGGENVPAQHEQSKPSRLDGVQNCDGPPRIQKQTSQAPGAVLPRDDQGSIGFQLLKEALEQAVSDMNDEGDKQKMEDQMKTIPFTSLLAQVLGDKRQIEKFEVGDQVVVSSDSARVKDLQKGHGEWNDDMSKYLGKEGTIKDKILHVVRVKFPNGQCWNFNPELLQKPGETQQPTLQATKPMLSSGDVHPGTFKRFDVVKVPDDQKLVECLQKGHGGWNPKMKYCLGIKGIVNRIDRDGDVYIECINGDNWTFNPEILSHVDMKGEQIEAGDFVIITDNKQVVRQLQKHHGGWVDSMNSALGKSGIVQFVEGDRAKVESKSRSFIWNLEALVLVAKSEEMLKAVLRKKTKG